MNYKLRYWLLLTIMLFGAAAIISRLVYLDIINRDFLLQQSTSRIQRVVNIPAHRGMITDRNGKPLAISAQVNSVWVNPKEFSATYANTKHVADLLRLEQSSLAALLRKDAKRHFVYLKRGVSPELGSKLMQLNLPGLYIQNSYKRFYPQADVTAHIVGFTNIDDRGQEGIELAYDQQLRGIPGKKEVLKDRRGHIVAELNSIREPEEGQDLSLSLDSNIQYLAYSELAKTIEQFEAHDGSIVVLDVNTGEVLAMVNMPSFNPNNITDTSEGRLRNRAATDQFEPGSTIKAFSMAAILASGKFAPSDTIDTNPGWIRLEHHVIHDVHNHGVLTVAEALQKSSNVAMALMSKEIPAESMWQTFHNFGFGEVSYCGFPGEVAGTLTHKTLWSLTDVASFSRGYGLSVTTLQLAHAYAIMAAGGVDHGVSLLKVTRAGQGTRKLSAHVARQVNKMLHSVTEKGGTGRRARVSHYQVAGKTGTAYIAGRSGYDQKHYMSSFIGFAPVSKPKIVVAVVVHNPKKSHFGGLVAAPAFAKVMAGALRLLAVTPDDVPDKDASRITT